MLVVAIGLFVGQAISAVLLYQAAEQRRETALVNAIAFRLIANDPRRERRGGRARPNRDDQGFLPGADQEPRGETRRGWRRGRYGTERAQEFVQRDLDQRNPALEAAVADILNEQLFEFQRIIIVERTAGNDPFVIHRASVRPRLRQAGWQDRQLLVAAVQLQGDAGWRIIRATKPLAPTAIAGSAILQTVLIFFILFGLLYLVMRRITQPLVQLTRRVEAFSRNPDRALALEESGPRDIRQLIAAHNSMEARIAAMLDEKDVMLGAIGHDLKTPLAALRVRIESVSDTAQRERMADSIEDITQTLDDILSLARVGRGDDAPERVNLSALAASIAEEFEDLGQQVELADSPRVVAPVQITWIKRGLRNLISNAVRYGGSATITLGQTEHEAIIRIEDDGPGIPPDQIEAMLEPFARGETSRNRATGGAGLGLTLARAIADQHGGSLSLSNRESGGLTAELRLPLDHTGYQA